jgi:hypothetical protein
MTTAIKIWFCAAVAMIAAAIADPLIESASNAGWFGRGNFTDHSTWDVVPVLLVGGLFVALHLWSRVRKTFSAQHESPDWPRSAKDAFGPDIIRLAPLIYAAQVAILFLMETTEQHVVYGHSLGGMLWLGGPTAVSLTTHATATVLIAVMASKVLRAFVEATFHALHALRALALTYVRVAHPAYLRAREISAFVRSACMLGRIGERAPPILAA